MFEDFYCGALAALRIFTLGGAILGSILGVIYLGTFVHLLFYLLAFPVVAIIGGVVAVLSERI